MNTLRKNSSGADVVKLQKLLQKWGYKIAITGEFDTETDHKVREFQLTTHLTPDGIVGGGTWRTLEDEAKREMLPLYITAEDYKRAAELLDTDVASVMTVQSVESGGRGGFLKMGYPTILFEGHIFWRELKKRGVDPEQYVKGNEDILYTKWEKVHYKGGMGEHDRLDRAMKINKEAAISSASWGMFQIMGFNYKLCGASSVEEYVEASHIGEGQQLQQFAAFLKSSGIDKPLREHNWAEFARRYNGSAYKENHYDEKLARAYKLYSSMY